MNYKKTVLHQAITVEDIVSVHYFEYSVDFTFSGEIHDFWELVYADKSELVVTADNREIILPQGCLFLHKPMEFHNVRGNGTNAPNSVIVSFSSHSDELYRIAGKIIVCPGTVKTYLGDIIVEARSAFSTPLGDPYTAELIRRDDQAFGAEQMISHYLSLILIALIRQEGSNASPAFRDTFSRRMDDVRFQEICDFLLKNVEMDLKSSDILQAFSISESSLQKLFQHKIGIGAMQYFQRMKVDRAKELIREKKLNFSEISQKLHYSSIHYFSRRFKSITGMTPSEYALSVQSIARPE